MVAADGDPRHPNGGFTVCARGSPPLTADLLGRAEAAHHPPVPRLAQPSAQHALHALHPARPWSFRVQPHALPPLGGRDIDFKVESRFIK